MTDQSPIRIDLPTGREIISGNEYVRDARGSLIPIENVKPQDLLQDETVRKIVSYGIPISDQVGRFKSHTMEDIGAFEALLAQEYDAKIGGKKGNKTLMTIDGLYMVKIAVADHIAFGPELQIAKELTDECLNEWASDARPEIRAIVTRAFNTDKEGQINRSEIYMLMRLEISDERWLRAMAAIRDAMRVVGSKEYVRIYKRTRVTDAWQPVTVDLAKA